MKNQWVTYFLGTVLVKVEGRGAERLINQLTRTNLFVWNIRSRGNNTVTFYISLKDLHLLRQQVRGSGCRVSFQRGQGAPFLAKRLLKNGGFAAGSLLFFAIIFLLSNMIWGIDIKGATPETEHQIRKELDKLGIRVGSSHLLARKPEQIQRELTDRMNNITWVGVEMKGTTFHFQVVEKNAPTPVPATGPQHLVANKKAVIAGMFVEKGAPLVKVHDYVKPGQMLVSGIIGNGDKQRLVPSKGQIWGKTWYKSNVEYPLRSQFSVFTGKEQRIYSIRTGRLNIPFWKKGDKDFSSYLTERDDRAVRFMGWKLPVLYSVTAKREHEQTVRELTQKEAEAAAMKMAREDLKSKLSGEARIDEEYILHEQVENGKVKLSVYFQVIEDIAEGKPIIQGD